MQQQNLVAIQEYSSNKPPAFDGNKGRAREVLEELHTELVGGLLYAHSRANSNTNRILETASFLYALIELLNEKGIITIGELDERKVKVGWRLEKRFLGKGMGVVVQEPDQDKYTFTEDVRIDCENRAHLCKAACCRMSFPLSMQDINEGIIKWDLRSPYLISQDAEGYCKHLERATCECIVRSLAGPTTAGTISVSGWILKGG